LSKGAGGKRGEHRRREVPLRKDVAWQHGRVVMVAVRAVLGASVVAPLDLGLCEGQRHTRTSAIPPTEVAA